MPSIDLSPVPILPPTILQEVRTSRLRKFGPVFSGIGKQSRRGQLMVSVLGLPEDEHDLTFHGGIDKAIHQYCSSHYRFWQSAFPEASIASCFTPGGFGENLVAHGFDEANVCVGDIVWIGPKGTSLTGGNNGCLLEVSLPRQPCFKLNQRFGIKNFAPKGIEHAKTGWYYRVKEKGFIEPGLEIRIVTRKCPKWSIARLHHYVHCDRTDLEVTHELMGIGVLGNECRKCRRRWDQEERKKTSVPAIWNNFRVVSKTQETPRIVRLELQAAKSSGHTTKAAILTTLSSVLLETTKVVEDIHDGLQEGEVIQLSSIQRSIIPNEMASHSIFIVGGIGITAFLAMMKRQIAVKQTLELHYAVRAKPDIAFEGLLSELGPNVCIYDKSNGERMDIGRILQKRPWNSQVFTCGPQRMIDAVIASSAAAGMSEDEVYFEAFTAGTSGDPFSVEVITGSEGRRLEVDSNNNLLTVLREAGFEVSSSCETGACGICRISLKKGKVSNKESGLTTQEKEKEMLTCVSRGIDHIIVEL